ncbi:MAG: Na+/H+ antiporter [Chloroflexota bacterium]|nr:Na+/H+ antiporter [Chloroflexota bacterium]
MMESAIGTSAITLFWMLIAVAAVAILTKRIRVPYTVALVIAGLLLAVVPGAPEVELTPDLILAVFLPTLVFEAAYNLHFDHLRAVIRTVSLLAIPGVLLTATIVATLMHWLVGFDWTVAFLFGAIVAATDPVSVVATFKQLGAPARLRTLLEGESLFNDGTALVLFRLLLGLLAAGTVDVVGSVGQFVLVIAGGLGLGLAGGYLVVQLMRRFDDYLVETVLTVVLAYGSYFLAEQFHVSGVIAVVTAGLVVGNYGQRVSFSPTSLIAVGLSWEFFGFLANSLIFLFVGLQVRHTNFLANLGPLALALGIVLLARTVTTLLFSAVMHRWGVEGALPWPWRVLLVWGGLRGALSLAMALSLPYTLGGPGSTLRDQILVLTFGVILFTLLVQGLTLQPLLKRLGMAAGDSAQRHYDRVQAQLRAITAAAKVLTQQAQLGSLTPQVADHLRIEYQAREQTLLAELKTIQLNDAVLFDGQLRAGHRQLLTVERTTLRDLFTAGTIDEETWRSLSAEIDHRVTTLDAAPDDSSAPLPHLDLPLDST